MALLADIIEVSHLNEASYEFLQLDGNSLALFDVDDTLLVPNDAILRPCGQQLVKKLVKNILENPSSVPPAKYPDGYLLSQTLLQAKSSLIDKQFVSLIRCLQNKKIRTIAFTAAPAGKLGAIDSMADWRIDELRKFGFDFASAFPKIQFLSFPKRADKEFYPIFKSGVLFASRHPKGDVLRQFLIAVQWVPSKVVFIDDKLENLQSTENAMKAMGIEFTGFHYVAADKLPCNLDEKLATFQFKYLANHAEWLSDNEARDIMKNNSDHASKHVQ